MCHANNEKRKTINDGRKRKISEFLKKGKLTITREIMEADNIYKWR